MSDRIFWQYRPKRKKKKEGRYTWKEGSSFFCTHTHTHRHTRHLFPSILYFEINLSSGKCAHCHRKQRIQSQLKSVLA